MSLEFFGEFAKVLVGKEIPRLSAFTSLVRYMYLKLTSQPVITQFWRRVLKKISSESLKCSREFALLSLHPGYNYSSQQQRCVATQWNIIKTACPFWGAIQNPKIFRRWKPRHNNADEFVYSISCLCNPKLISNKSSYWLLRAGGIEIGEGSERRHGWQAHHRAMEWQDWRCLKRSQLR